MTNGEDHSEAPRPFSFEMPAFDPNRAKRPSSFVGIPENFLLLIGHVIGAWSQFDISFNRFLGALLIADAAVTERWDMDSFKRRSTRLRQLCQTRFADNKSILKAIDEIITDARRLQTDRNLIAHGRILIKMQTFGVVDNQLQGALSLHCVGTEAGKRLEREYPLEALERVRYEFAYLCGRLSAIARGENLHLLQIMPPDTDALLSFLAAHSQASASVG